MLLDHNEHMDEISGELMCIVGWIAYRALLHQMHSKDWWHMTVCWLKISSEDCSWGESTFLDMHLRCCKTTVEQSYLELLCAQAVQDTMDCAQLLPCALHNVMAGLKCNFGKGGRNDGTPGWQPTDKPQGWA